jgi:hypothetical protein
VRQVFHIDVDVSGLISLETAMLGAGLLSLEIAQVANPVPAQTAFQPRAGNGRDKELSDHRLQVI